jgi:hypothetical protein
MCQVSYVAITKKQHAHAKAASSDFLILKATSDE